MLTHGFHPLPDSSTERTYLPSRLKTQFTILVIGLIVVCIGCGEPQQTKSSAPNTPPAISVASTPPKIITRNVIQDRNGNIWTASFDGVFKYDGKTFTNMMKGESTARFFSILEDTKGNFWYGSIGAGAYYFDGTVFKHFTIEDGLLNNEITSIFEDRKGHIWLGTNGGASRYNGNTFTNYLLKGDTIVQEKTNLSLPDVRPPHEVNAMIEDRKGNFWFATRGNTFIFDGKAFTVFRNGSKAFQNIRTLIEATNGNIWFGGNDGVWRYDGKTFKNITTNFGGFIYEDSKGNIWTSAQNQKGWALTRYEAATISDTNPQPTEITSNEAMVFGIVEANDGRIWFGTTEGVKRYDGVRVEEFK